MLRSYLRYPQSIYDEVGRYLSKPEETTQNRCVAAPRCAIASAFTGGVMDTSLLAFRPPVHQAVPLFIRDPIMGDLPVPL